MIEVCFRRGLFATAGGPPAQAPTQAPAQSPSDTHDAALALGRAVLQRHGLARLEVTIHANRRHVLCWRLRGPAPQLQVHWALLPRPDAILAAIEDQDGARQRLLKELPPPRRVTPLRPRGSTHDLEALLAHEVPRLPAIDVPAVTWGRWPSIPPRRRLRLGSCALPPHEPLIRIHPVLDHRTVPAWFVRFILFHELLHLAFPPEEVGTRRWLHPPAFRRAEASHLDHDRALAWERAHLDELILRCRQRRAGAR